MEDFNQSAKTTKKDVKTPTVSPKRKAVEKSSRKTNKTATTQVVKKEAPVVAVEKIEVEKPSLTEAFKEDLYNIEAIANYMLQENLSEEEALVLNLSEDDQVGIFGFSALTRIQRNKKNAEDNENVAPDPTKPPMYEGISVERVELLGILENELTHTSLEKLKEKVISFPGTFLTFIADDLRKFGGNFILILSQELDNQFRLKMLEITVKDVIVEEEMEEASDSAAVAQPKHSQPWINQGSDREIIHSRFVETRPRIVTNFERPREYFHGTENLSDQDGSMIYTEIKPYEDKAFGIPILELERGVSCSNIESENSTNTEWRYPRNQVVQYIPRVFTEEEIVHYLSNKTPLKSITNIFPLIEQGLKQNLMFDFLFDDYANLAPGDHTYDNKSGNTFKEIISFTDLKSSKDKAVTHIEWHPTIDGLVAMSVGEGLTYDERLDNLSRILTTPSFIIVWSFFEPIQPQLLLEAPEDILCFQFCPTNPLIVAGGCFNGEVILWDISRYQNDLSNVVEKVKNKSKVPLFQFDENDSQKVPISPWCANSNIEASHAAPITQIMWLPDHIEITRAGFVLENTTRKCIQLATCAIDSGIYFWDIRPEKSPLAVDKIRDQLTAPIDVPLTFSSLDAKWKPFLRVTLFRPDNGNDHCPTRFCMRERQGDSSILQTRENLKRKDAAENDPNKVGLPKLQPLDNLNTHFYVGTEDGDIVYVDWIPLKDAQSSKIQTTKPLFSAPQHSGPISYINRSIFFPNIVLVVGGWTWSLWKENINSGPLLASGYSPKALTGGLWSPTRPSVFYIIRADGYLESWDILDKTHEPALIQSISPSALTSIAIKIEGKKQMMAIGDMHGALRVFIVPYRMKVCGANELAGMTAYIERECQRRDFVLNRWLKREQERIEKENNEKRMAGIATVKQLTEDERLKKLKVEYEQYLSDEREFLRSLGMYDEDDTNLTSRGIVA